MSCKERPKFNIRIELIREEIKNEILIEKEIKFKYQNINSNSIGKSIPIIKEKKDIYLEVKYFK